MGQDKPNSDAFCTLRPQIAPATIIVRAMPLRQDEGDRYQQAGSARLLAGMLGGADLACRQNG
ncbi:hypothetical protein [Novosphingobium sp.]|uniref:hypothetical protein n=1 Tax=Novosphingobium sp. TaxID=1874826 RepID=UPI0035B15AEB